MLCVILIFVLINGIYIISKIANEIMMIYQKKHFSVISNDEEQIR